MSMSSQGPGWWQASDGRWYPPEQHPSAAAAPAAPVAPVAPTPPSVAPGGWDVPPDGHPGGAAPTAPAPGPAFPPSGPPMPAPSFPAQPVAPGLPPSGPPGPPPDGPGGPPSGFSSPPARRSGPRWGVLVGVGVGVLVLLGLAIVWAVSSLGDDASEAPLTASEGDTDVYDLVVGDCFDDPTMFSSELVEVAFVDAVPCDQPHDAEVYGVTTVPTDDDETFPGDDQIATTADDLCFESFESYVGAAYEESELDFNYYVPTEDSWAAGDRVVTCVLLDYDGEQLTEPLEGSGR